MKRVMLVLVTFLLVGGVALGQCANGQCGSSQQQYSQPVQRAAYATCNFYVTGPSVEWAKVVADECERQREKLALDWFGKKFPDRPKSVTLKVVPQRTGDTGGAAINLAYFEPYPMKNGPDAEGTLYGDWEQLRDGVIPHEVMHVLISEHLKLPCARWLDEGLAVCAEGSKTAEQFRQAAYQLASRSADQPFKTLCLVREYPQDSASIDAFYSKSASLVSFMAMMGGKRSVVDFLDESYRTMSYGMGLDKAYALQRVEDFDARWRDWAAKGSPLPETSGGPGTVLVWTVNAWQIGGRLRQQPPPPPQGQGQQAPPSRGPVMVFPLVPIVRPPRNSVTINQTVPPCSGPCPGGVCPPTQPEAPPIPVEPVEVAPPAQSPAESGLPNWIKYGGISVLVLAGLGLGLVIAFNTVAKE